MNPQPALYAQPRLSLSPTTRPWIGFHVGKSTLGEV